MTGPVDVLGLLAAVASDNNCPCGEAVCSKQRTRREAIAARAAVAELVEAARGMDGVGDHDGSESACWQCMAVARLNAALAKFGGAA